MNPISLRLICLGHFQRLEMALGVVLTCWWGFMFTKKRILTIRSLLCHRCTQYSYGNLGIKMRSRGWDIYTLGTSWASVLLPRFWWAKISAPVFRYRKNRLCKLGLLVSAKVYFRQPGPLTVPATWTVENWDRQSDSSPQSKGNLLHL